MTVRLVLAGAAVVALLAAHLLMFGFAVRHLALPAAAVAGLAALTIGKHLGLLAPLAARLRRRAERGPTLRS
jgi:hypothetical protein